MRKNKPCASYARHYIYKRAETLKEVVSLSCLRRAKGVSFAVAKSRALRDIVHDYERGFCYFPGNESGRVGHWVNSVQLAKDYNLTPASEAFLEKTAAVAEGTKVDTNDTSFEQVLNDQFKIDEAVRFLGDHQSVA